MGRPAINYKGKTFNYWTILSETKNYKVKAMCKCGKTKEIFVRSVITGISSSCGCFKKEYMKNKMLTHGGSKTKLYHVWVSMNSRCTLETSIFYKNYGGRGISVCNEWKNSFETFKEWAIKEGYAKNLSIDRIDNNGNYRPINCKWSTRVTQQNNTRHNHLITIENETHTMAEWARTYKIKYETFKYRVKRGYTGIELLNN